MSGEALDRLPTEPTTELKRLQSENERLRQALESESGRAGWLDLELDALRTDLDGLIRDLGLADQERDDQERVGAIIVALAGKAVTIVRLRQERAALVDALIAPDGDRYNALIVRKVPESCFGLESCVRSFTSDTKAMTAVLRAAGIEVPTTPPPGSNP